MLYFIHEITGLGVCRVIVMLCKSTKMKESRIMYIELKKDGVTGPARIGRITLSKSGKTLCYRGQTFETLKGKGFKCNYYDVETIEGYWISACKKNGRDRLYPGTIEIDDDAKEEYLIEIRNMPERKNQKIIRCIGKYGGKKGKV